MNACFTRQDGVLHLLIRAVPGASKTEIKGIHENRLRIRIAAAPEDGRANEELISFLAKRLGCPKKAVVLLSGEKSRLKTIGLPPETESKLAALTDLPL